MHCVVCPMALSARIVEKRRIHGATGVGRMIGRWIGRLALACCAGSAALAEPPLAVVIDDSAVFPENIAAARDGTLFFGSAAKGTIFRALPGKATAETWIAAGSAGMKQSLGLWADPRRQLLWVCAPGARATTTTPAEPSAIKTFDLKSGAFRTSYAFEGGGRCNDLTIAKDGTVYAGDFDGGRVMRLKAGEALFRPWLADPRLVSVDGLAFLADGQLYANTYRTNLLFRIALEKDGAAGALTQIATDRPLAKPDGMRTVGADKMLLVEGEGRLVEVTIAGDKAALRLIRDGFSDSPVGVALARGTAFVVQAKWAAMRDPGKDPGRFGATAVPYKPAK
jgi:sugar lactone lactonase YvrE